MKTNLSVVSNNLYTPKQIVSMIMNDTWKSKQPYDIRDFMIEDSPNYFIPNLSKLLQVREFTYNNDFVETAVTYVKNTEDYSGLEKGVIIYFPEDADFFGKKIQGNSEFTLGGTHGGVIKTRLGIFEDEYYVINFKLHLNSDTMKVVRIGNLLNQRRKRFNDLSDESIRNEFYQLMDKRKKDGLEAKPSDEEKRDFLDAYPQISIMTIANWIAHHKKDGGRREPRITYTQKELQTVKTKYKDSMEYDDYAILSPMHLDGWKEDVIAQSVYSKTKYDKDKVLVTFYASSHAQMALLDDKDNKFKKKVRKYYDDIKSAIPDFPQIDIIYLKH